MSNQSDPVTDALAKFTPTLGFDRDGLLFEAGRRSARGSRTWPVVAGLLALGQVATLVALWPRDRPTPEIESAPAIVVPESSPLPRGVWTAASADDEPEISPGEFVSSAPLKASSRSTFD